MIRILAVDLGGTKTAVGIVGIDGRVIDKESAPTPLGNPRDAVELIAALASRVQARAGRADALGVALPGVLDRKRGILLRSPSSGWSAVPFVPMIEEALGLRAEADNDVNACAWAEARFGAGRGLGSFFWMQVSTGIGGAVVCGGRLVRGAGGMAGEVGHLVVNPGGEPCGCGHRGCLEAEASGPAWRRRALRRLDAAAPAGGAAGPGGFLAAIPREAVDARTIAQGARAGDALCAGIVEESAAMLARGIAAVYTVLDPDAIVLGGGVAGAQDLILPIVRSLLPSLVLAFEARSATLVPSALGYDAALIGAASLALYPDDK
jgi:glucokinase